MYRHCPNMSKIAIKYVDGVLFAMRLRCKSWGCDYCADFNGRALRRAAGVYFHDCPTVLFTTLTAPGDMRTSDASYRALRRAWPVARKWLRRHYGSFRYVNVWELHINGAFHLHGIWAWETAHDDDFARLVRRRVKDNATRWGIGYIADVQAARNVGDVRRYVTKQMLNYTVKDVTRTYKALPAHAAMYMASRGFSIYYHDINSLPDFVGDGKWTLSDPLPVDMIFHLPVWSVVDRRYLTTDDFAEAGVWPVS